MNIYIWRGVVLMLIDQITFIVTIYSMLIPMYSFFTVSTGGEIFGTIDMCSADRRVIHSLARAKTLSLSLLPSSPFLP